MTARNELEARRDVLTKVIPATEEMMQNQTGSQANLREMLARMQAELTLIETALRAY